MRVKQAYISKSVDEFGLKFIDKYGLIQYHNENDPVLIYGLYSDRDYEFAKKHTGIIIWRGSDSMNIRDKLPQYKHIAISDYIYRDLHNNGIECVKLPLSPQEPVANPIYRGDCIYFYSNRDRPYFYNEKLIGQIHVNTGIEIIKAYYDSYDNINDIYRKCFVGLRLLDHDGLSNTVVELGLLGRNCIYNGDTPNAIKWRNMRHLCELIRYEYEHRHDDNSQIAQKMADYINISGDWLELA